MEKVIHITCVVLRNDVRWNRMEWMMRMYRCRYGMVNFET